MVETELHSIYSKYPLAKSQSTYADRRQSTNQMVFNTDSLSVPWAIRKKQANMQFVKPLK